MLSAGMRETAPMWKSPLPVPAISSAASLASASAVKWSGYFAYAAVMGIVTDLAIVGALPPDQRDLTLVPGVPRSQMRPVYCLPLTSARPDCRMPCGVDASSVDARALLADERLVLVHRNNVVSADGTPSAQLHPGKSAPLSLRLPAPWR